MQRADTLFGLADLSDGGISPLSDLLNGVLHLKQGDD
jgi:hypothetical protein